MDCHARRQCDKPAGKAAPQQELEFDRSVELATLT
jgi:hypothetical protein